MSLRVVPCFGSCCVDAMSLHLLLLTWASTHLQDFRCGAPSIVTMRAHKCRRAPHGTKERKGLSCRGKESQVRAPTAALLSRCNLTRHYRFPHGGVETSSSNLQPQHQRAFGKGTVGGERTNARPLRMRIVWREYGSIASLHCRYNSLVAAKRRVN